MSSLASPYFLANPLLFYYAKQAKEQTRGMPANSCLKNNSNNNYTGGAAWAAWSAGGVAAATAEEGVAIYLNLPFNLSRCLGLNFFSFWPRLDAEPSWLSLLLLQQKSINYLSLKLSATCHYVIVYSLPGGPQGEKPSKLRKLEKPGVKTSSGLPRLYQYSIEMGMASAGIGNRTGWSIS